MSYSIRLATLTLVMSLCASAPVSSQSWSRINSTGYGVAGAALGVAATAHVECTGFLCIPVETVAATLGGAVLGAIGGHILGSAADRAAEAGRPLSRLHLVGVGLGTILGGAAMGGAVAVMVSDVSDGDPSFVPMMTIGAAAGSVLLWQRWDELRGSPVEVTPIVTGEGQFGLSARIPL